jgi:diaminopimelate epimerase
MAPNGASADVDLAMRMYNSDGTEPEMCGNGIRCLARFVAERDGRGPAAFRVHTLAGRLSQHGRALSSEPETTTCADSRICCLRRAGLIQPVLQEDGQVCVDMGEPVLDGPAVPTTLPPSGPGGAVVRAPLEAGGRTWAVTCVSMGNPHAVIYLEQQVGLCRSRSPGISRFAVRDADTSSRLRGPSSSK